MNMNHTIFQSQNQFDNWCKARAEYYFDVCDNPLDAFDELDRDNATHLLSEKSIESIVKNVNCSGAFSYYGIAFSDYCRPDTLNNDEKRLIALYVICDRCEHYFKQMTETEKGEPAI